MNIGNRKITLSNEKKYKKKTFWNRRWWEKIKERNDLKKVKHDLEIEVMSLTTEKEKKEDEQNNIN